MYISPYSILWINGNISLDLNYHIVIEAGMLGPHLRIIDKYSFPEIIDNFKISLLCCHSHNNQTSVKLSDERYKQERNAHEQTLIDKCIQCKIYIDCDISRNVCAVSM